MSAPHNGRSVDQLVDVGTLITELCERCGMDNGLVYRIDIHPDESTLHSGYLATFHHYQADPEDTSKPLIVTDDDGKLDAVMITTTVAVRTYEIDA